MKDYILISCWFSMDGFCHVIFLTQQIVYIFGEIQIFKKLFIIQLGQLFIEYVIKSVEYSPDFFNVLTISPPAIFRQFDEKRIIFRDIYSKRAFHVMHCTQTDMKPIQPALKESQQIVKTARSAEC